MDVILNPSKVLRVNSVKDPIDFTGFIMDYEN